MTSLKKITLGLGLWTSAALCVSTAAPANAAPSARGRIVVLGDSITAGYGLDPAQAYPALLQRKIEAAKLPFTVANAGLSGDTMAGGLRRIDWALGSGAEVLIVALGGNDGLRGLPPKQTAASLAAIIQRARAKVPGLVVLVAGMQMPESMGAAFTRDFRALFPRVAAENGATLIPYLLEGVGGVAEFNQPDYIHPNAEGQKRIAEYVWTALRPVLEARASQPVPLSAR